jgi:hypothetical protein
VDPDNRQKDYTGAWGGEAKFSHLYSGPSPFINRLEGIIKIQYKELLWKLDEWETEWLDNGWTTDQLSILVDELIKTRHYPIKRIR